MFGQNRIFEENRQPDPPVCPACSTARLAAFASVLILLNGSLNAQTVASGSATVFSSGMFPAQTAVSPMQNRAPSQPGGGQVRPGTVPAADSIVPLPPLPSPPAGPGPAESIPRVIPLDMPADGATGGKPAAPHVLNLKRDSTGLIPDRPPGPVPPPSRQQVTRDLDNLIQFVKAPEAELSVPMGQSKLIQTKRVLSRVAITNPNVADIELLTDQPNSRLLNLYGRSFGTTSLTIWDESDRPVSFLVRVTLDTLELESRIRQGFPGSDVKVRQIGPQIILEGQVPDSKTMSDVLQLVSMNAVGGMGGGGAGGGGLGGGGGMGGGGSGGGGMGGGGMGGGGLGGGGGGMGGGGGGGGGGGAVGARVVIINRVTVPGPRQVLLHVKIAELNRSATRDMGVSWLYAKGKNIIGSPIGNDASITATATPNYAYISGNGYKGTQGTTATFNGAGAASPAGNSQLFGIFQAGHFSLFIDALRSNNLAKILAEPNLVALDGQPARFLVGGMFPFPVPQSSSIPGGTAVVTVQFQRFGTILTFLPQILPNDVIRLDVEPVISQLNFAQGTTVGTGQVPSIDERSARTVVELREGQTLAIAGLLQATTNASTIRVPGLGDLPIVGPLFSANQTEIVETETIVLVTPELVSPVEKNEVAETPGDRVYEPTDPEFYFLGRIEGKLGRPFRSTVGQQDPLNLMKHFQSEQQWVVGPHGYAD